MFARRLEVPHHPDLTVAGCGDFDCDEAAHRSFPGIVLRGTGLRAVPAIPSGYPA
jgi:hypothetical protein